jgi:hypothetical protein
MKVDWQYDLVFSFQVAHPRAADNDFQVIPAAACRQALSRAGMLYKNLPGGGLVAVEKRVRPDGSAGVARGITALTRFTFLLLLNNKGLLADTPPFNAPNLPPFSGRRRVLYLSNTASNGAIDARIERLPDDPAANRWAMPVSAGDWVAAEDLASLTPTQFELLAETGVSQLRIQRLAPQAGPAVNHPVTPATRALRLTLPAGAVRATRQGGGLPPELWVADDNLLSETAIGIIDIYKDPGIDYGRAIRYDVVF